MSAELLAANLTAHWIQAGVLSLAALCAVRLLRVKAPRLALAAFQLVLLLIVLLPWMQRWQMLEQPAPVAATQTSSIAAVDVPSQVETTAPAATAPIRIDPTMLALSVIAAGVMLRLCWLLLGFIRLRRFARQSERIATPGLAEDVQARVGAAARYLEHPTAGSPSTFGIFRPHIVLPARFASLSAAHQEGALCHELIHVKRHDVAAALTEELLMALFWFHPWIWVIRRRIRVAREQVVDQQVLALVADRAEYVRCLIEMSGHDLVPHLSHAGAAMVRSNELRARVDAIFQEVRMSRVRFVTVSAALAAVVGAAAWLAMAQAPLHAMAPPVAEGTPVLSASQTITVRPRPTIPSVTSSVAIKKIQQPAQQAPQPTAAVAAGQMRRLIKVAYAEYPPEALDKEISGVVKLNVVVNAAGDVTMAIVTSGPEELRVSAFKSAMGLKYSPGADTAQINLSMEYRLDPQGWGVRVIQDSGTVLTTLPRPRGELPANLGVPVRVGGEVAPPKKVKDMAPVYPPLAQSARVQGVVILEAVIDTAGNVVDAKVLRSVPLLDQAAIDAVMQWQYTPTLLNGAPVPVIMTVTVNFTLRADPTVALKITLPNGATPSLAIRDDGGLGTVSLPDVGTFGFTPIKGASATGRTIAIYQITEPGSPLKPLGSVQVELNGGVVQSSTTPSFGIELVRLP